MELVPGLSLEKYVDRNFMSILTLEQCRHIWTGAAQGLQWVHEKGLLYNDLKAENVMYDPNSQRVVLIDFGIAAHDNSQISLAAVPRVILVRSIFCGSAFKSATFGHWECYLCLCSGLLSSLEILGS